MGKPIRSRPVSLDNGETTGIAVEKMKTKMKNLADGKDKEGK